MARDKIPRSGKAPAGKWFRFPPRSTQRRTGHLSPYVMMDHCGDSMHPRVTGLRTIDRQVPFSCCTKLRFAIPPAIWDGISICFTFTLMSRDLEDGPLIMRATHPGG